MRDFNHNGMDDYLEMEMMGFFSDDEQKKKKDPFSPFADDNDLFSNDDSDSDDDF